MGDGAGNLIGFNAVPANPAVPQNPAFAVAPPNGPSSSGTFPLTSTTLPQGTTGTFIRAPRITHVGDCEVLARRDGDPVLVRKGPLLAACFHPELVEDHPVVAMFAAMVRRAASAVQHDR